MERIYLDNNATTFMDPEVLQLMFQQMQAPLGNPSSIHYFGQEAKSQLIEARESIARFLGVKSSSIIFTSGATEAINTAIKGFCDRHRKEKGHIISSSIEHAATRDCLASLEKKGWEVTYLPVDSSGEITCESLEKALRSDTRLIALMAVNNETGVKNDIEAFGKLAKSQGLPLFVDGVAMIGKERCKLPEGVSAFCFSGHKIHAPKGVGVLCANREFRFEALVEGGSQEYGRRGGTENVLGILALAKAVELLEANQEEYQAHMLLLRDRFESLLKQRMEGVLVNGEGKRVCNTSNLSFEGIEGESLIMNLDLMGLAASHGSACSAGAMQPSHVLTQMGYSPQRVRSAVRFAFSRFNTLEEVEIAVDRVVKLVERLRQLVKLQ